MRTATRRQALLVAYTVVLASLVAQRAMATRVASTSSRIHLLVKHAVSDTGMYFAAFGYSLSIERFEA